MARVCLIVEDEPPILRLVALVLQGMGCETLAAPNAEAALDILASAKPDLIITDVRLPGMNGDELARELKSNAQLATTPVILMSAYGEPPRHNGDGFLAKPFDIDQLVEFVQPYVGI